MSKACQPSNQLNSPSVASEEIQISVVVPLMPLHKKLTLFEERHERCDAIHLDLPNNYLSFFWKFYFPSPKKNKRHIISRGVQHAPSFGRIRHEYSPLFALGLWFGGMYCLIMFEMLYYGTWHMAFFNKIILFFQ